MPRRRDGTLTGKAPRKKHGREAHGFHAAQRFLAEYGTRALDMRTRAGKDLQTWKDAFIEDLGGLENVSTARLTLLDVASTTWFLYQGLRVKVVTEASDGKLDRETLTLLRQTGDSLTKTLQAIGIERVKPPPEDLTSYVQQKYGNGGSGDG